ncbi:MAG: polysaccharide biosynthesis protein [Oscillospiraceae bacterium]|nr:polysaccharide biosynthesis protein [Oscillospiraceae bacterium]
MKRTLIIGGGAACEMLLNEIFSARCPASYNAQNARAACYEPLCILDNDPKKIGTEIHGVKVVGTVSEISKFVDFYKIEQLILAIPSLGTEARKVIIDACSETKLPLKIVPFIGSLIFNEDQSLLTQVRDIRVEELLGRDPVKFNSQNIKSFIKDKVCLVTGGGGSIGSELVRQIAKYSPRQIIIVDIYENNAYEIQQELLLEYGNDLNLVVLIASVRDYYRINQVYERYKPNVVFHAAAHKHVPLMEVSPMEAIKNNVIGTFNVATLAQYHNVERFVMISTDKAVNPTNAMGASKRCCEMIVQYLAQQNEGQTEFVATRFGNVLGSNGSVIPLFKRQIEQGKDVTVTHPDIIRYFMTIPEAVSLVLEAAAMAKGGEIFVLDMGQPVKIVSLAENLIRMYGKEPYKDINITFTGLRPGEKLMEELLMDEEGLEKTDNELIYIGKQIPIDETLFIKQLRSLRDAARKNKEAAAMEALHMIVPTFTTPEEFNAQMTEDTQEHQTAPKSNE